MEPKALLLCLQEDRTAESYTEPVESSLRPRTMFIQYSF